MAALTIFYIALTYLTRLMPRRKPLKSGFYIATVFDGATFAASIAIMAGVFDPDILHLLGSMTPFLIVAALVGILYSLHALVERASNGDET